uniref:Uncharacterized protein n=1 Tax=Tanacetum cinerariifolium TaxID=118510 RepID=A0A6L2K4M0_TANCI|nr:hypothetical protein [Tanacetum cinerariifolium]
MLVIGRYAQWRSRFLRYIDTRTNGDALRKCILEGPYTLSTVVIPAAPATENSPAVPEHTTELEMKYTQLLMHAKQLMKCGKLSKDYNKKQFDNCYDASLCLISSTTSSRMVKKEVNELCAERIATNANPLALVATAQLNQDPYYQTPQSHKSYAPTSKASLPTKSHATTRNEGKEIAKSITPLSESASKEDIDPKQAQRDKDMQKKLALIEKYFKKIYKPTNNNLRTSSNFKNKNMDTTPSPEVQQTGIQCFNYKKFGQFSKECRKPKRVKHSTYHKEKMLPCKQTKKGVPLQEEQSNWLADMDEEIGKQELEAHYSYMEKIQEIPTADSGTDSEPLK